MGACAKTATAAARVCCCAALLLAPCRLSPQNTQHTTHTPNPTCAQRFRPITVERPKALLPLVNAPMIEYALEWLAMNRVEEVGLCFFVFCSRLLFGCEGVVVRAADCC